MLGDERKFNLCSNLAVIPICNCDFAISSHVLISVVISPSDTFVASTTGVLVAVEAGTSVGMLVGSSACTSVGDGVGDDVTVGETGVWVAELDVSVGRGVESICWGAGF